MSSFFTRFKRFAGIDIRSEKYTYAKDPAFGHTATSRIPDRWVKTTCGYCSVGCGMLLGVRDNQAVAARGNLDHPVNRGKLCPKGLSEHHILSAPGRAKQPLLRKNGLLTPVSWDEALDTMAELFRDIQLRHGNESLGVVGTGQLLTEEFYTLGKLVQLGLRTRNHDGKHHPLHGLRGLRLQTVIRLRWPTRLLRRYGVRRCHPPHRRQYR